MIKLVFFFALVAVAFAAPQYLFNSLVSPYSYSIPAPYAYSTGNVVTYAAEPVEQHGYSIAY